MSNDCTSTIFFIILLKQMYGQAPHPHKYDVLSKKVISNNPFDLKIYYSDFVLLQL